MVPQDIQTDGSVGIDVGVVNLGRETDFGGLERVVRRERNGQEENTSGIGRVTLDKYDMVTRYQQGN